MATVSITFSGADKNPYLPSDNPAGGNFTSRGAAGAALFSNALYGLNASANTLWSCDVDPQVNTFTAQTVFDTVDSAARGVTVFNSAGNGFMFIARNNDVRVFTLAAWVLSGSALATYATTFATGGILNVDVTQNTGTYVVKNGATTLNTFVNTTYTSGLKAGPVMRGVGRIRSFALEYTPAYSIDTLTDPLVPGAAVTGTETGFSDGAITANFGGFTIAGTVSGANITGTLSSFVDGGLCPLLPAAAVSGTFTQGANTAGITRPISVPAGLQELRDGSSAPANFAVLVLGDSKYLGQAFVDGGNPLTIADRSYINPAYGLKISQDGKVELNGTDHATDPVPALPYTTTLWIRRGADGRMYEHQLTISEAGGPVVVTGGGLTMTGLTMSGLTMTGLTMSSL